MAGYSPTPLPKKLGIKSGHRLYIINQPRDYEEWIRPLPDDVVILQRSAKDVDIVHLFVSEKTELVKELNFQLPRIKQSGMIWVSWPKRASKVRTDITEDVIRDVALPLGLVDIKVCAVNDIWSGLKLVIRKERRKNS